MIKTIAIYDAVGTELFTGITAEFQPTGNPLTETITGASRERLYLVLPDKYLAGIQQEYVLKTLDAVGAPTAEYEITEVEDWEDQLDMKVRFIKDI